MVMDVLGEKMEVLCGNNQKSKMQNFHYKFREDEASIEKA